MVAIDQVGFVEKLCLWPKLCIIHKLTRRQFVNDSRKTIGINLGVGTAKAWNEANRPKKNVQGFVLPRHISDCLFRRLSRILERAFRR